MTPRVAFHRLRKSYDGVADAVRPLDLVVPPGEFLTLLGPSGSGKTTTLMMLAGFETPSSGTIELDGRAITSMPAHRRGIGVVFQNYALFPHMTVAENLAFPLQMRNRPRAEIRGRVARALDVVRLSATADRRPAQLSGGQQQRIALARALIFDPAVVLMDEPLGALDRQLREHMQTEIRSLHKQLGLTLLYVTHDQTEALTMADRIAVFRDGAMEQVGPPAALYDTPASAFVAGFLGENNALAATLVEQRGALCRVELPDGGRACATAAARHEPGAALTLCVRPESAGLIAEGLPARLVEAVYHGDHIRLRLDLSGQPFTVRHERGVDVPAPGQAVCVGWAPGACLAFPREAA